MLEKIFLFTYPTIFFIYLFIFVFRLREMFPAQGFFHFFDTKIGIVSILSISFLFFLVGLFLRIKRKKERFNVKLIVIMLMLSSIIYFSTKTYTIRKQYNPPVSHSEILNISQDIKPKLIKLYYSDGHQELFYLNKNKRDFFSKNEEKLVSRVLIRGNFITWLLFQIKS